MAMKVVMDPMVAAMMAIMEGMEVVMEAVMDLVAERTEVASIMS